MWKKKQKPDQHSLETLSRQLADVAPRLETLERQFKLLDLEASEWYDKINAALQRLSTRDRRAKAKEEAPSEEPVTSWEQLNKDIMEGRLV